MSNKIISTAPGRVCLFGDHQDYLGLPIIATTIDKEIKIEAVKNDLNQFNIYKKDLKEKQIIELNKEINGADFLSLSFNVLKKYNCIPDQGFDIEITSTIPINSGLSSSSALIVAWINFLLNAFTDIEITAELLAKISYQIEVKETGGSGGKMDQYTISYGETIYLDTKTDKIKIFDGDLCDMIIAVSNQEKDTQGLLKKLKEGALKSIKIIKNHIPEFNIQNSFDINLKNYLSFLDDQYKPFFNAAVENYRITLEAKKELEKSKINIDKVGLLMNLHHRFLKNDLNITTTEIDEMINVAEFNGSIGSKIVGSGGGGSIVCLSKDENSSYDIINELKKIGVKDAFIAKKGRGPIISYE